MVAPIEEKKSRKGLPSTARAEKGMTLSQLLKACVPYVRASSTDLVIKRYTPGLKTKGGLPAARVVCQNMQKKGHKPQTATVIGLDKEVPQLSKQKRVRVDCSCEFFLYNSEYALWTWGAAKIQRSNGEPAVFKNPGNVPLVCKHLYAALKLIKTQGD